MPKRRRERDRPKAGPDTAYNPNKRVLLSYDSDDRDAHQDAPPMMMEEESAEEVGEVALGAEPEGAIREQAADSTAAEGADEEDAAAEEGEDETRQQAHTRLQDLLSYSSKSHATGQWQALGGHLNHGEDAEDGQGYDSATEEAMAYLRAVQSERQRIPEILMATRQVPNHDHELADQDEAAEYYLVEDGTYIGRPDTPPSAEEDASHPQHVFTEALKQRFLRQRRQLSFPPSAAKLAELGDDYPISFPQGNNKAYAEWHRILSSKSPKPAQLRSLDPDTVWNILALLQKHYLVKGKNIKTVTSAWVWSLLAKLEEVGNMSNDDIFPLRQLGKRAVFLQLHFRDPEAAAQLEALEAQETSSPTPPAGTGDEIVLDDDLASIEAESQPLSAARRASQPKVHQAQATDNTLATLDMMLVVIGHVFGQRDLLEFRIPWAQKEEATIT